MQNNRKFGGTTPEGYVIAIRSLYLYFRGFFGAARTEIAVALMKFADQTCPDLSRTDNRMKELFK